MNGFAVASAGHRPSDVNYLHPPYGRAFVQVLGFILLVMLFVPPVSFAAPLAPGGIDPAASLQTLLGIPYREDGAVDEAGRYTLFADRTRLFATPGLNCSGFVVQSARLLLRRPFSLDQLMRDRLGDSGPGAPLGQDWDFGWDLVMNISEGLPRRILLPGGKEGDPAVLNGKNARGHDIHSEVFWPELQARMRPGHVYLASFSKESGSRPYALLHYHVGLFVHGADGVLWFYHTTHGAKKSIRINLSTEQGRVHFMRSFNNTGKIRKMLFVVEVPLPS